MTKAELVAEIFANDGQRFELADGRTLEDVLVEQGAFFEADVHDRSRVRCSFDDGSAIVATAEAWDLGFSSSPEDGDASGCFCWPEANGWRHDEACESDAAWLAGDHVWIAGSLWPARTVAEILEIEDELAEVGILEVAVRRGATHSELDTGMRIFASDFDEGEDYDDQ